MRNKYSFLLLITDVLVCIVVLYAVYRVMQSDNFWEMVGISLLVVFLLLPIAWIPLQTKECEDITYA